MHRAAERESARKARTTMKASIDDDDFGPISSPGDSHRRRRATLVRASASNPGRASASSQPASSLPSSPISPEAAQRAARRAHRKRLAQIVVKHWRWFARDALADLPVWAPFRRQTLLARALRSWVRTRAEARDARRGERTRRGGSETRRGAASSGLCGDVFVALGRERSRRETRASEHADGPETRVAPRVRRAGPACPPRVEGRGVARAQAPAVCVASGGRKGSNFNKEGGRGVEALVTRRARVLAPRRGAGFGPRGETHGEGDARVVRGG